MNPNRLTIEEVRERLKDGPFTVECDNLTYNGELGKITIIAIDCEGSIALIGNDSLVKTLASNVLKNYPSQKQPPEEEKWHEVVFFSKNTPRPIRATGLYKSKKEFLGTESEEWYHWIDLKEYKRGDL